MKLYYNLFPLAGSLSTIYKTVRDWDIDILRYINLSRNQSLDSLFNAITHTASVVAYGIPALLLLLGWYKRNKLIQKKAVYLGISVIFSAIIALVFKYSINRTRPFLVYTFIQKITWGGSASFPSGHTCDAFAIATSVSIAFKKWYIIILFYLWAVAVGYSRIDLGVHYPTDVLAGIIIGCSSAFLAKLITKVDYGTTHKAQPF